MHRLRTSIPFLLLCFSAVDASAQDSTFALSLQTDEARAALSILDTLAARREPSTQRWNALFSSDGYRRLQRREAAMRRAFTDSAFSVFLRTDSMIARRERLRAALADWERVGLERFGRQALSWLPAGARIKATVYILIKPIGNSFVFEPDADPAIMLFLDPDRTAAQFANTVTHELHHIGFASACRTRVPPAGPVASARMWLGAFGEGLAMLAAAGSPGIHPHAASERSDRARWDRDVANFGPNLRLVESFVRDVLDERLKGDSIAARAASFYGVQGPWYTVGWKMAAVVVTERGRDGLLTVMCDPVAFMRAYNASARVYGREHGEVLPVWDESLLVRLAPSEREPPLGSARARRERGRGSA
jgi:hypothetical protein